MPFGNKARQVKAYEFGCLPPTEGEEKALEVMKLRYRLWNQLVELDHKYDEQRESLLAQYVTVPDDEEHHKEYLAERKAAFKLEEVREKLRALEKDEYEESKTLYQNSGLYWGNYLDITNNWQRARKKIGKLNFHSSRDGGKVSVQWPTGMNVEDAFNGKSKVLSLLPVDSDAYANPVRAIRRRLQRSAVGIRIASNDNRQPVWLKLPCVLHRPLPNGLIRSASVLRERIATHWRWKLVIVVEHEEQRTPVKSGTIGIDIGWRKRPNGLRVCYWADDKGQSGEVVLSPEWVTGMTKTVDIRSIRDINFNEAVDALRTYLKQDNAPDWMKEYTRYIHQWKSTAKLAWLAIHWRDNRFDGDEMIFPVVEEWRKRDKHLYEYQANLLDRLIRTRREQYRLFASWVSQNYNKIVIEDFDLRKVTKRAKKGGSADELPAEARHQRVLASTSILRLALLNACEREGLEVEKKEAAYTTRICHVCGSAEKWDNPAELIHTCQACKDMGVHTTFDQDENASKNLLRV